MRILLLGAALLLLGATPARAEVITFASDPGGTHGLVSFNLPDTFDDFLTEFKLTSPTGGIQEFNWPPTSRWPDISRPTRPAKVPEPATLSLLGIGAAAAIVAK